MSRVRARLLRYAMLVSTWGLATSCVIEGERPTVDDVSATERSTSPQTTGPGGGQPENRNIYGG